MRVGAGGVWTWRGDACVAWGGLVMPVQCTPPGQGDASVPTRLAGALQKNLPLRAGAVWTWRGGACVAHRHQSNEKLITIRRGEGGGAREGGPFWAAALGRLPTPAPRCIGRTPPTGGPGGATSLHPTS